MIIKTLIVGPLEENTYIVGDEDTRDAIIIDPGDEPERIMDAIREDALKVDAIICTHAHFDHIGAIGDVKKGTGTRVLIHGDDLDIFRRAREHAMFWGFEIDDLPEPDGLLRDGDLIRVGGLEFRVIHTPGHSPGSISIYGEGVVFTGDTIFRDSVGRTDLPGGSLDMLKESFRRLLQLPEDTRVLSGHGPETTIGRERVENFFVHEL
jgi:glyoxylase-like metal-dependent hydrolase (beta-lactamase superfamily II)